VSAIKALSGLILGILELLGFVRKKVEEHQEAKEETSIQDGRELAKREMETTTDEDRRKNLRDRHGYLPK